MGGTFLLEAYIEEGKEAQTAELFSLCFTEVERIENLLTDFKESPFQKINDEAGKNPVQVPSEIFNLIETSLQLSKSTHGVFDISYASIGHLWRKYRLQNKEPDLAEISSCRDYVDYKKIILDPKNSTVFLPHPQMRIGLGGIGKGYAVDRAFELLYSKGPTNFLVNGAGDLRVHSDKDSPRPWRIGVRNPFNPDPSIHMGVVQVKEGAVATSGDYVNFVNFQNKKFHHVLDPRTGLPSEGAVSATILAKDALTADTRATVAMILGPSQGIEYLNQEGLVGFLVDKNGRVLMSQLAIKEIELSTQNKGLSNETTYYQ